MTEGPLKAHEAEEWAASLLREDLPYRVKVTVAADDAELATSLLDTARDVLRRTEPVIDGPVAIFRLEVDDSRRWSAAIGPAWRLCQSGVKVVSSEPLDIAETVSDTWLQEQLGGPGPDRFFFVFPFNHPLAAIGGAQVVRQLLAIVSDSSASLGYRDRAAQACHYALFNTPDGRLCRQVLEVAVQELRSALQASPTRTRAPWYVTSLAEAVEGAVQEIATPEVASFRPIPEMPEDLLAELLASPCQDIHWPVLELLAAMPGTLSEHTTAVVAGVALHHDAKKGSSAQIVAGAALRVLARGPDTTTARHALLALSRSHHLENRLSAMSQLAHRAGRPMAEDLWERLLQDRSLAHRMFAGELIETYGTAEDVPAAAIALRHALKSKHTPPVVHGRSGPIVMPPWGSGMLAFLWQHREEPTAAAEIQRLRRQWPKIRPDLAAWVAEHLPDLPPSAV
ncbi:hypothetical protein CLV92_1321 [Kineococcus xinjiangensis]|uniref:HEAT repeat protein n=1 Tax=Kineococcus xinjiangensis TaxID=512762 RepID=A0A2S6IBS2_9ACTN|nr:hypothetical protein [Kineococcus xinjiangensis]PPK89805.1 hypothetical protein CLV92_1321 [Kineococcus xinjiangensis]